MLKNSQKKGASLIAAMGGQKKKEGKRRKGPLSEPQNLRAHASAGKGRAHDWG